MSKCGSTMPSMILMTSSGCWCSSAWRPWIAVPSWSAIDCTICCGVGSAAANAGTAHAAPKSIAISNNKDRFNMLHFSSCPTPCAEQKVSGLVGWRRRAGRVRRVGTARFRAAVDQELADQVLDAHRRLGKHHLVAVLQERGRATRLDANILVAQ